VWTLALPFQLGPSKRCLVAAKKLIEFDIEYNVLKLGSSQFKSSCMWAMD
jgi:hypothetical protein